MLGRARGAKTIKPILNEEFLSKCGLNKPEDIINEKNDNGGEKQLVKALYHGVE